MESIVVVLSGEKVWNVHNSFLLELPRVEQKYKPRAADLEGFQSEAIILAPGDVLLIPSGLVHEARCVVSPCLHLTFGIEIDPPFQWEGLLHALVQNGAFHRIAVTGSTECRGLEETTWTQATLLHLVSLMRRSVMHSYLGCSRDYNPQWLRGLALDKTRGVLLRSLFPLESNRLLFVSRTKRKIRFRQVLLVLLQATEENKEKDAAADRAKNMICAGMDALNDDLYLETLVRDSLFDHGLSREPLGGGPGPSLHNELVSAVDSLAEKGTGLFDDAVATVEAHAASEARGWSAEQLRHLRRHQMF